MKKHTPAAVYDWLHALHIPVSASYLQHQLLAHPDYPSLLSITDTLDALGIEHAALVIDKDRLSEIPGPFLAHVTSHGGAFVNIGNKAPFKSSWQASLANWDGVIVVARTPNTFNHHENAQWLQKEKKYQKVVITIAALIALFAGTALWLHFSWTLLGLMLSSLAGLLVSVMIVLHELGYSNVVTDKLCAAGEKADCNAVLKSGVPAFIKVFTWSDAGITYFTFLALMLCLTSFANTTGELMPLLGFFSAGSLVFTFYSLYYQYRIVKKWCPLCLLTVGILWMQFLLLMPSLLSAGATAVSLSVLFSACFIGVLLSFAWMLLIRPLMHTVKQLRSGNYSLMRFRNNPELFAALLKQQKEVDVRPFAGDLQLGNIHSPVQLLVACNPYCEPCATAHSVLHDLLTGYDIGLTIRFALQDVRNDDKRTRAARYILQLTSAHDGSYHFSRKVVADWYRIMNLDRFTELYPLPKKAVVDELLYRHEAWSVASDIKYTPTLFINGYQMPASYAINDLPGLVKRMAETICLQSKVTEPGTLTQAEVSI